MFSSEGSQTHRDENRAESQQRLGDRRPASFGLRAAILAGLVAATAGGVAATEAFTGDPVRAIAETHTTCCIGQPGQPN